MQDQSIYHHPIITAQFPEQERLICPRCESTNTKFCYYNNYNLSQPRHYCKNCRRYWTKGGALRNIPVGGGTRKPTKRSSNAKRPNPDPKMGKSLHDGGKDVDCGSSGSGHDPSRISTNEPDLVVVGLKEQSGKGLRELELKGLSVKEVDQGEDVDPGSVASRLSNYRLHSVGSVFGFSEDMDNCNVMKGDRSNELGLGVGMGQVGKGVDGSRGSDIGSGHESGYGEKGINYLGMQKGNSGNCWSNGNRWTNLTIYNIHDKAFN